MKPIKKQKRAGLPRFKSKLTVLIYPTRHNELRRRAKRGTLTQNEIVDRALREYFAKYRQ